MTGFLASGPSGGYASATTNGCLLGTWEQMLVEELGRQGGKDGLTARPA